MVLFSKEDEERTLELLAHLDSDELAIFVEKFTVDEVTSELERNFDEVKSSIQQRFVAKKSRKVLYVKLLMHV